MCILMLEGSPFRIFSGSKTSHILDLAEWEAIEQSGKKLSEKLVSQIGQGPVELDLVRSGLDDTMRNAFQEIRERYWKEKKVKSYRTSAMSISIEKIYERYSIMGIYP